MVLSAQSSISDTQTIRPQIVTLVSLTSSDVRMCWEKKKDKNVTPDIHRMSSHK